MSSVESVLIFLLGVSLMGVFIAAFQNFDKLIRLEFDLHRLQWEADGTPRGYFWVPGVYWQGRTTQANTAIRLRAKSSAAFSRVVLAWMFSTPEWMKGDPSAVATLRRFRILAFLGNGLLILGVIVLAVTVNSA